MKMKAFFTSHRCSTSLKFTVNFTRPARPTLAEPLLNY